MRKLIAAGALAALAVLGGIAPAYAQTGAAHNAVLPCNIPVPDDATVVSPGAHDCIVQYVELGDAAAVVNAAMRSGRYVYPNAEESGFISEQGGQYVIRVADVSPAQPPLQVVLAVG